MKTKLTITMAFVLVVNLVALWCLAHRYEFHTGMNGKIIWRCNNFTGKAEYSELGDDRWVPVSSQTPWVPPEVRNTELPDFGPEPKANK